MTSNAHINDAPNKDEKGIHLHCLSCNSASCHQFPQCLITYCPNQCGVQYHQCKEDEHLLMCRDRLRPCINSIHGCPFDVTSVTLMSHLEHCPASVVHCGINWNRAPLHSTVRDQWLPFHCGNPVGVEGDLDTEFAISDQERLKREYRHRMARGARRMKTRNSKIGRLKIERMAKLERMLTVTKIEAGGSGSVHSNEDTDEAEEFLTCDNLFSNSSREAENKNHISNTNLRDSYFEVPNTFIYGGNFKQQIITKSSPKRCNDWSEDGESFTAEEIEKRRRALSGLKLSTYPLGFNVAVECLPGFYNQYPLYSIICSALLRRDQYQWHCRNSHCDIGFHVNGWLMERCPLAQYGCPYTQMRLKPERGSVRFLRQFSCFTSRYDSRVKEIINEGEPTTTLLDLPTEVLVYLMHYLDNLSLNCIAKSCHLLRDLCYSMVDELGMVVTTWRKKSYETGANCWKEDKKIRTFSIASPPIRKWTYTDVPHIGQHLQTCVFYKHSSVRKEEAIELVGITEVKK